MLPAVVAFNVRRRDGSLTLRRPRLGTRSCPSRVTAAAPAVCFLAHLQSLMEVAGMPKSLKDCGVKEEMIRDGQRSRTTMDSQSPIHAPSRRPTSKTFTAPPTKQGREN